MDSVKPSLVGSPEVQGAVQPGAPALPGATSGLFGTGGQFNSAGAYSMAGAVSSVGGVYTSIMAGKQAKAQFDIQAGQYQTQAELIKVNASEQANMLRKQLLADLGSVNASTAARGIDTGSGTPRQIVQESIANVSSDISKLKSGAAVGASQSVTSAARAASSGASAEQAGYYKAATGLASKAVTGLASYALR